VWHPHVPADAPAMPGHPAPSGRSNAIAEHLGHGRRDTARTNQIKRSFEDASRKRRALELICAA